MDGKLSLNELSLFKKKYKEAAKNGATSFVFKGKEILCCYAQQVIEYMSLNMAK